MSQIPSNLSLSGPATTKAGAASAINDVNLDQFINLMITELQNQDPLNPLDNNEFLQQITQIREIGATEKLSSTLQAVLTGQNLTTASSLIGKEVQALSDSLTNVQGVVDRVTVDVDDKDNRTVKLHIGDQSVPLKNVREIVGRS